MVGHGAHHADRARGRGLTGPAAAAATLRPLERADAPAVRRLFRATLSLGEPLPFAFPGLAAYEALCLDWYLGPGRDDGAVLELDGAVVGYTLVCLDERAYRRWAVPAALTWAASALAQVPTGPAGRLVRLRVADGVAAWRHGHGPVAPAHAHLQVARGVRFGLAALRLVHHVDARCRAAALPAWYGEVNALPGRRVTTLEARIGPVVARMPNRTLSWLAGAPVERLTVLRHVS